MTSLYDALELEIYILQHDKAGVAEVHCGKSFICMYTKVQEKF